MNIEKLKRLERRMRRIRHEEHYSQYVYMARTSCGTAACLAGQTVLLEGARPKFDLFSRNRTDYCVLPGAQRPEDIAAKAREILGLDLRQSTVLFAGSPVDNWPKEFAERWGAATRHVVKQRSGERPSRIAADLLKAIISGEVVL